MKALIARINAEPALVVGLIRAILVLLIVFGVPVTDEQKAALLGVVMMGLSLVTRSKVSPKEAAPDTKRTGT